MRISSFDIFDTCVVRKCGVPKNLFDVLSYRVFSGKVSTEQRLEFIACRLAADDSSSFNHLYDTFDYTHPLLLSKEGIMQKELECEHEMMVSVEMIKKEIEQCRDRGDHIIFISDMYLPTDFLKQTMLELGILREEDTLYVSGDCGYRKCDGTLFQFIRDKERLDFSKWHHYGDNLHSDIQVPNSLGITTHLVNHRYLPYEQNWIDKSNNITFHTGGIMAGIGRSLFHSIPPSPHNAFAIDIVAPFFVTLSLRIISDAQRRGITKLFFCSRDCFGMYHVAKKLEKVNNSVKVYYFYSSREALYNTNVNDLLAYLDHIGLASKNENVGIVDIRSSGKSLRYINDLLMQNGYNSVFGYYFEMYCTGEYHKNVPPYYCEFNRLYQNIVSIHHCLFETFFSLCPEGKTTGYNNLHPVIDGNTSNDDYYILNIDILSSINLSILLRYTDFFIQNELFRYYNEIYTEYVIPSLIGFLQHPKKDYLQSLTQLYIRLDNGSYVPYIAMRDKGYKTALWMTNFSQKTKIRTIRRAIKFTMRIMRLNPIDESVWWEDGTNIINNHHAND